MALHWHPVGPEPAQTYWLRRAAVALAVLVPLALLLSLLGGEDDEDQLAQRPPAAEPVASPSAGVSADPSASADPSTSPDPGTDPSASASAGPSASVAPCPDEVLRIEAAATEDSFPVGARPELELRVTNTGRTPCSRDLGQAAVELLVVSGDDRIWSSDDCAPGGRADVTTLQPGAPEVSTVTWSGTRSRPRCAGEAEPARAGTYRVNGRVGELRESGESFVLR